MNKCNSQKAGKYDYKNEDTSLPAEGGEGSYPFKCLTDIKKNAKKKVIELSSWGIYRWKHL